MKKTPSFYLSKISTLISNISKMKIDTDIIKKIKPYKKVKIIGVGSSYNSGLLASKIINSKSKDIFSDVEYTYSFLKFESIKEDIAYIIISQSGESINAIKASEKITQLGGVVFIITENINSSLCAINKNIIKIHNFNEESPFKTIGFFSSVLKILQLFKIDINTLNYFETNYKKNEKIINDLTGEIANQIDDNNRITFLSSGLNKFVCDEIALKGIEMTWLPSFSFEIEDFTHGKGGYVSNKDVYIIFDSKNNSRLASLIERGLLKNGAKNINTIDLILDKNYLNNLFLSCITLQILIVKINSKLKRHKNELRFRDLVSYSKTYN